MPHFFDHKFYLWNVFGPLSLLATNFLHFNILLNKFLCGLNFLCSKFFNEPCRNLESLLVKRFYKNILVQKFFLDSLLTKKFYKFFLHFLSLLDSLKLFLFFNGLPKIFYINFFGSLFLLTKCAKSNAQIYKVRYL